MSDGFHWIKMNFFCFCFLRVSKWSVMNFRVFFVFFFFFSQRDLLSSAQVRNENFIDVVCTCKTRPVLVVLARGKILKKEIKIIIIKRQHTSVEKWRERAKNVIHFTRLVRNAKDSVLLGYSDTHHFYIFLQYFFITTLHNEEKCAFQASIRIKGI